MKIVCVEPLGISEARFQTLQHEFAAEGHTFEYFMDRTEEPAQLLQRIGNADAILLSNIPLREATLAQCPQLKMISVAFVGLDHIDLRYCQAHHIEVRNAAGYSTTAVSELAVGLMLDVLRHITELDGTLRNGGDKGAFLGRELRGKTVGVVGTGAIGTAVVRLLQAFGCRVLAYSRSQREEVQRMGVEYVPLPQLMQQCDIVTLHVPLTDATHHLISSELLATMKPTAILINTARGNVVDIDALADALRNNRLAGAGIDVYEQEPPLPASYALLSAPHCVCVPHVGFATREAFDIRADIVFNNIRTFLQRQ